MDVQYNNHIYSNSALWSVLQADGIISDQYAIVEIWIGESPYKIVKAVCGKIDVHTIAAQKYITPQAA